MKSNRYYILSMFVLSAALFLSVSFNIRAQVASDEVSLANDIIVNNYQVEFDIYLKSTNNAGYPTGFPYGNGQYRINFNNGIRNGANTQIFFEIINGSTELTNPSQVNEVVTNPTLAQSFVRIPARLPVPYANASIISPNGIGTKLFRMRMTSRDNTTQAPVPFVANSLANLALSVSSPGATTTSYVKPDGTVSNCTPQLLSNLLANMPLNASVTPPTAFAVTGGGAYCQGAGGLQVGLAGSTTGVTYTLYKGAVAQTPTVPGTGAAITFGNQLAGIYTAYGTNAGGTTAMMTGSAVITESIPVTPTFAVLGPYCQGATPGTLPGTSLDSITGTWSPSAITTNVAGTAVYTFTPANGQCATTAAMNILVNTLPGPAGTISGPAVVNQNQSGVVFSVTAISNTTGYSWSLPPGALVTAGANTNSITVTFSSAASTGIISVYGTNPCGNGFASPGFLVTVGTMVPNVLTLYNLNILNGSSNCFDAVQLIKVAGNGSTFQVQNGAQVTMIAGVKISYFPGTFVFPGGYLHGYITSTGNYCLNPVPQKEELSTGLDEKTSVKVPEAGFSVFPNPTAGTFTLESRNAMPGGPMHAVISDMHGKKVQSVDHIVNNQQFSVYDQPSGIYFIKVIYPEGVCILKIVRQ